METPGDPASPSQQHTVKLFVGGLTGDMTKETLAEYFGALVEVIDSFVVYESGKPAGFGFVTTKDKEDANKILATKHTLNNSILDVKPALDRTQARDKEESDRRRKIFVGGLPKNFPDEKLTEYFAQYGQIQKSYVVKDPMTGKTRGFGFVIFATHEGKNKALEKPNVIIGGSEAHIKPAMAKQDEREGLINNERAASPSFKKSKKSRASQYPDSRASPTNRSRNLRVNSPASKNQVYQLEGSHQYHGGEDDMYSERFQMPMHNPYDYAYPQYYQPSPVYIPSSGYMPHKISQFGSQFHHPVPVYPPPSYFSQQPGHAIGAPVQSINRIQLYPVAKPVYHNQIQQQPFRPSSSRPVMMRNLQSSQLITNRAGQGSSIMGQNTRMSGTHPKVALARSAHAIGFQPRAFSQYEADRGKFIPKAQPEQPRYESSPFTPHEDEDDAPNAELSRVRDF